MSTTTDDMTQEEKKAAAETIRRAQTIQGFRDLANFLETHPTVPVPRYTTLNAFVDTREELAKAMRASSWEKVYNAHWFSLRKEFGDEVILDINAGRETVCRRVVTGTRKVEAQPEHEVEVVEWICDDVSVLRGGQ